MTALQLIKGEALSSRDLEKRESIIADGLRTFVDVGRALMEIRDGKLYREAGFKTFEAYCRSRWEMGARRAQQLMAASSVVSDANNCSRAPSTESQVRPLLKIPEDERAKVWEMAVETAPDGKVTARHVAKVVREHIGEDEPVPEREAVEAVDADKIIRLHRDVLAAEAVVIAEGVDAAIKELIEARTNISRARTNSGRNQFNVSLSTIDTFIERALEALKGARS